MIDEELKTKIENAYKEDFIGDVIFSDTELEKIFDKTSFELRRIKNEYGATINFFDYKLIFIALINVTKEWNSNEDAFFDYVYKKLIGTDDGNGKIYKEICKIINKLSDYKFIYILNSFQKKYYATLISHAFAPISSTESFFDMCWEIYSKDLDYYYSKNDNVYLLVAQTLNKKFSNNVSDEDSLTIGSVTYSFRAGMKGLALNKTDLLAKLIERTIKNINLLFNSAPIEQEKYFETLLQTWWKKKNNNLVSKERK